MQFVLVSLIALSLFSTTAPVVAISSLPLQTVSFVSHTYIQPFATFSFPVDANTVALGVTIQVPLEDCDQSSRWSFLAPNLLSAQFNASTDRRLCAVYIFPANPSSVTTVGTFNVEVRKLWYYNNRASPSLGGPVRIAWNYWMSQKYIVSEATYQHAFYCLPSSSPFLAYFDAATACNSWMQDPTDPTATGATLASLYSPRVEWLIQHQRAAFSAQETDIVSGQAIGYVTYIGLFGTRAQWDNGVSVSYKNYAPSNPTGNFPTVMDQYGLWKSVVVQESHAYCCESSGVGSIQASQNGMIRAVPVDTAASTAPVVQWAMDYASARQFPFAFITLSPSAKLLVYSFVASIHPEDCDGSLRFLVDPLLLQSLTGAGLALAFDVELCTVRLSAPSAINSTLMHPFIRQIRLMVVKSDGTFRIRLGATAPSVRLLWGFTFGDATPWYIANYPLPHFYQCFFSSLAFDDADDACAALSGGLNEAYLLTVQVSWEQSLLQSLQSRVAFNDDVWFGLNTLLGSGRCANGDSMNFSNWAVNQPAIANSPAVVSASDGTWVSSSGASQHSYCCEWNVVPTRGLSGAMNITPTVFSLGTPEKQTAISYKPFQPLRPFRNISSFVYPALSNTSVFGVTMQLPREVCMLGAAYQLWAPPGVVQNGFVFCASVSSGCNFQVLRESCMWYLRSANGSAVAAAAYLDMMGGLVLNMSKRIAYTADVPFGWAFWANSTVPFGPVVIHPTGGYQFTCADPSVRVTFVGAMEQCRYWHGDGFLASVLSDDEEQLLELARRISNGYSLGFGSNAWIGLNRNNSVWVNGDANVYQNWGAGQPDKTGPTQSANNGQWTNVAHAHQATLPTASFCCKRNGFNELTSVFGGIAHINGPTYSTTVTRTEEASLSGSRTGPSATEEVTTTRSGVETRSVVLSSRTRSITPSSSGGPMSRTLSLHQTTSVPVTTPPVTSSLSAPPATETRTVSSSTSEEISATRSKSKVASPSKNSASITRTVTEPLPPVASIHLVAPLVLSFTAGQVRAGSVTVEFESVFAHFQASDNKVYTNGGVTLTLSPSSPSRNLSGQYFDFSNVGRVFLSSASIAVDETRTRMKVQLLPVPAYDPIADEVLLLTIGKAATDVPVNYPPEAFAPFIITISPDQTDPSITAKVFSTIFGALALAAPAAFRDQQVLYMLGRHYCAKPYMRGIFLSGLRVVSPAAWEDTFFSEWVGAAVVVGAAITINFLLLSRATCTPVARSQRQSIFARALFPSIAVLGTMWMHVSVTFFSLRLLQDNINNPYQNMTHLALGGLGVSFSGLATVAILVWSWITAPKMQFEVYDEPALHRVGRFTRPLVPFGRWASTIDRTGLYWIVGEYRYVQYVGAEWLFGWLFTWFISYRPDSMSECYSLFLALGFCALALCLIVAAVRPFRSWYLNGCSMMSFLCLCVILCLCAPQVRDPDGPSQGALLTFRWILIALSVCRSVGNGIFLILEARLISAELDSYEKERWRQMHALKRNSSLFQAQWLQKAHDEKEEARKQGQLLREMESMRRFSSVAFDGDVPPPLRDPTILDAGYRFPQSFRKSDASAIVNMDFPEDGEALPQPPLPTREYSFGSMRSPKLNQRSLSRAFSQHKKFSIQYVESDGSGSESGGSSSSSSEELYDPFASSPPAGRPHQGMYKNSLLYRDGSYASARGQQLAASSSPYKASGPRGSPRVSFYSPDEPSRQSSRLVSKRRSSADTYDPFGSEDVSSPKGSRRQSSTRNGDRGDEAAAARESVERRLSRSRWDSTVRQMMQQRDSILNLDDPDL